MGQQITHNTICYIGDNGENRLHLRHICDILYLASISCFQYLLIESGIILVLSIIIQFCMWYSNDRVWTQIINKAHKKPTPIQCTLDISLSFFFYNPWKTPHSYPVRARYGCHSWVQIWLKFYHCNCCAVCTITSYITVVYWESIIFGTCRQILWCVMEGSNKHKLLFTWNGLYCINDSHSHDRSIHLGPGLLSKIHVKFHVD